MSENKKKRKAPLQHCSCGLVQQTDYFYQKIRHVFELVLGFN